MKFIYCCSKDELSWYVDLPAPQVKLSKEEIDSNRVAIRQWIDATCSEPVYVWNDNTLPSGGAEFFFKSVEDAIIFRVRWL